jgi:hypothetical protein
MTANAATPLIDRFMHTFFGYGNLAGRTWFIGMEEGGGDTLEEVSRRFEIWSELGCPVTTDVAKFHHRLGMDYFFQRPVRLQRTWSMLIRMYLSMKGMNSDKESVKEYQGESFGRQAGEICSLELLPLPAPSTNHWFYADWFDIPELKSRELYREKTRPWRARQIRGMVEQYQPTVVVCYGAIYRPWYEIISGQEFIDQSCGDWAWAKDSGTTFALVKHPAARGVSNRYFEDIGQRIAQYARV